jgi:1,5-anhydro-D-fructose reductase (1,5-anhydro-D-mannitol-forming)
MSKINWLVAGIGDIARRRVLPAILAEPRSALYGTVTRTPAKAAAYSGARVFATVEEAVGDPAINAVYIALPVAMHAPATIAALRAGKHVLCEKPMAMSDSEAAQMVAEAHSAGRMLGAAYYRRLYPKLIRAKELVVEGAIGRPVLAEANCHSWLNVTDREWLLDPKMAAGGPLYDIASHRIDAMHFLFGRAERVSGMLSNAVHSLAVEDSATVLLGFAGGVHGVVDVRWNSQIGRDQFRILGTDGEINLDPLNGPELRIRAGTSERVESLPPHENLHFPLVANFVDAVLAGDPALLACPGEQGHWTDWAIEQAARAERVTV